MSTFLMLSIDTIIRLDMVLRKAAKLVLLSGECSTKVGHQERYSVILLNTFQANQFIQNHTIQYEFY